MYARLVRFETTPGQHAAAQAVSDELVPLISAQPGCESVTMFGDELSCQYGIFVLWATQSDADAAAPLVRPQLDQHLAGHLQGAIEARLFEVLSS